MDFFQHQESARKRTGLLVTLYALAVVLIIAAVYVALAAIFLYFGSGHKADTARAIARQLWNLHLFEGVAVDVAALIGGGTVYKVAALSSGGRAVAELLGGRPIAPDTADPDERRLLNVVEEIALAAGVPVPPVFLLADESGINAFAAGHTPADAVIGVTRGCVQHFSRDELQGVVAHEFSHVLNARLWPLRFSAWQRSPALIPTRAGLRLLVRGQATVGWE